jgi:hypothetical protein
MPSIGMLKFHQFWIFFRLEIKWDEICIKIKKTQIYNL